MSYNGTQGER